MFLIFYLFNHKELQKHLHLPERMSTAKYICIQLEFVLGIHVTNPRVARLIVQIYLQLNWGGTSYNPLFYVP